MIHAPDQLVYSFSSALGAILGYLLHIGFSWAEWRKLGTNSKLTLREFVVSDPPALMIGIISTAIVYFSLPLLGSWSWLVDMIGFVPGVNFFSAAITAYFSNSVAVKLRNISRKLNGDT
jgi:hypothetical protein